MSKTRIYDGYSYKYVNDHFGDIDAELQQHEPESSTHYRKHLEQNEARKERGEDEVNYEPLNED